MTPLSVGVMSICAQRNDDDMPKPEESSHYLPPMSVGLMSTCAEQKDDVKDRLRGFKRPERIIEPYDMHPLSPGLMSPCPPPRDDDDEP
ncbi:hypothetical protein NL108_013704 [Boleophthalmus pectinirostris]|nr:hypothetical protein NL108_013704 [Boleophthalmus pectinirostris]